VNNYGQIGIIIIIIIGGRVLERIPAFSTIDLEEIDCWRAFWHTPRPQLCAGGAPWGNWASSSVKHPEINIHIIKSYQFLASDYSENNGTVLYSKFVAGKTIHDVKILFHVHSVLFGFSDRIYSHGIAV